MARYLVIDADRLRAAILYEAADASDERDAIESAPIGVIPVTGAYVVRKNQIANRYLVPTPGSTDERIIVIGAQVEESREPPTPAP